MSPFTKRRTGRCTTQSYKHCLFQAEYFRPKSCLKIEEISISYFCKLMLPLPWIVDEWYLIFCQADKIYDKQEVVGKKYFLAVL